MTDYSFSELLGLLYDLEQNGEFRQLLRELERRYRFTGRSPGYRREAYVDTVLTMLWEQGVEPISLSAGQ